MSNTVQFTINLDGNAYTGIVQLDEALNGLNVQAKVPRSLMDRIDRASFKINNIFQAVRNTIGTVGSAIGKVVEIGGENELQKLDIQPFSKAILPLPRRCLRKYQSTVKLRFMTNQVLSKHRRQ